MAKSSFELKLLIDTQSKKVIFAEARKDAVDFLFYILTLPVGTIVKLLREEAAIPGSQKNLYQSLENLDDSYIHQDQSKNTFLSPSFASSSSIPLLSLTNQPSNNKFYLCPSTVHNNWYCRRVTDDPRAICPHCNVNMTTTLTYVAPPPLDETSAAGVGIVKEVVTYMIMDDLVIKPMSTISSITLLNNLKVKDMGALEEKVKLGTEEALKVLRCMMNSTNVLTDVFMKGVKYKEMTLFCPYKERIYCIRSLCWYL